MLVLRVQASCASSTSITAQRIARNARKKRVREWDERGSGRLVAGAAVLGALGAC